MLDEGKDVDRKGQEKHEKGTQGIPKEGGVEV